MYSFVLNQFYAMFSTQWFLSLPISFGFVFRSAFCYRVGNLFHISALCIFPQWEWTDNVSGWDPLDARSLFQFPLGHLGFASCIDPICQDGREILC